MTTALMNKDHKIEKSVLMKTVKIRGGNTHEPIAVYRLRSMCPEIVSGSYRSRASSFD